MTARLRCRTTYFSQRSDADAAARTMPCVAPLLPMVVTAICDHRGGHVLQYGVRQEWRVSPLLPLGDYGDAGVVVRDPR
jgi:hypothetical protein